MPPSLLKRLTGKKIKSELHTFFYINRSSVSDPTVLWNAHKAHIRGILIKLAAQEKITSDLIDRIKVLETRKKSSPSHQLHSELRDLRISLRVHIYLRDLNLWPGK